MTILEWQQKYEAMKTSHDTLVKRVQGMERYLSDLPTADDHSKNTTQVTCSLKHWMLGHISGMAL